MTIGVIVGWLAELVGQKLQQLNVVHKKHTLIRLAVEHVEQHEPQKEQVEKAKKVVGVVICPFFAETVTSVRTDNDDNNCN